MGVGAGCGREPTVPCRGRRRGGDSGGGRNRGWRRRDGLRDAGVEQRGGRWRRCLLVTRGLRRRHAHLLRHDPLSPAERSRTASTAHSTSSCVAAGACSTMLGTSCIGTQIVQLCTKPSDCTDPLNNQCCTFTHDGGALTFCSSAFVAGLGKEAPASRARAPTICPPSPALPPTSGGGRRRTGRSREDAIERNAALSAVSALSRAPLTLFPPTSGGGRAGDGGQTGRRANGFPHAKRRRWIAVSEDPI